jgi:hypothetical protein
MIKIEALRRTYAGLRWLEENKKFKPKYADAKFRSMFGYWPPDEIIDVPPYVLSQNLLWWITRSNQAWKKAKRLEEQTKAPQVVLRLPASEDAPSPFMTAEDWGVEL